MKETANRGARLVNVTEVSRKEGGDLRYFTDDGLHPSAEMYALWAELVLPEAIDILRWPGLP